MKPIKRIGKRRSKATRRAAKEQRRRANRRRRTLDHLQRWFRLHGLTHVYWWDIGIREPVEWLREADERRYAWDCGVILWKARKALREQARRKGAAGRHGAPRRTGARAGRSRESTAIGDRCYD